MRGNEPSNALGTANPVKNRAHAAKSRTRNAFFSSLLDACEQDVDGRENGIALRVQTGDAISELIKTDRSHQLGLHHHTAISDREYGVQSADRVADTPGALRARISRSRAAFG